MTLVDVWILYAICGSLVFSAIFAWAVRARQFSDQDRARYLALKADQLLDEHNLPERTPGKMDRYTGVMLFSLNAVFIFVALIMASKGH